MSKSTLFNWTLRDAYAFWALWKDMNAETEGVQSQLDAAEAFMLKAQPHDIAEVIFQIEVATHSLSSGGRSDGLDIDALETSLAMLRQLEAHPRPEARSEARPSL